AIATAASDPLDPVRVIITVRDDFLGRMAASEAARAALTQVVVLKQLAEHDLVDVLVRPLDLVGYRFEDASVPRDMVRSVIRERSSLPLLQFAAQSLWDDRDRDRHMLLRSAYERMGGVGGALARHADGVLDSLSADEQALARQLVLRLVTPDRTRRSVARSSALDGLPKDDMQRVLARIVEARLVSVTKVRGMREPLLELAHESLITTWSTLARWLDESESDLALASEIEHAAQLWEKRGELWRGDALREATRAVSGGSVELSELARRFVEASQKRERGGRRQRRLLVAAAFVALAAVATGAIIAALAIAEREELAIVERNEAQQQSAAALRESARAAWAQGSLLEARAKVRASLEVADSTEARALWWQLGKEQLAWKRTFGAVVRDIDFSPDGSFLFATMSDGTVYLIDPATSEGRALRGHGDDVIGGAISPDSEHVASASWDRTVRVWKSRTGELESVLEGHTQGVLDVAFSPDGKLLASASFDTTVRIWQDGKQKHRIDAVTAAPAVQFHPSGELLAWSDMRGGVHLWDLRRRAPKRSMSGHRGSVYGLAFSPDGRLLASGSSDGTVRIWDVDSGRQVHLLAGHADTVSAISFRPDGKRIATGSWDHTVRVWNVSNGTLEQVLTGHSDHVPALGYSPDGRILASGSGDRSVRLWKVDKLREVTHGAHRGAVRGVALSPDAALVVSGGMDGAIIIWDATTGAIKKQLTGHTGEVADVDIDPTGKLVASAGEDQTVRLWELPAGASKGRAAQQGRASSVAFHPDGSHLASGSGDGRVRLWNVEDLSAKTLVAGDGMVADVAFSPDGKRLAAAGRFPGVHLWSAGIAQPSLDAGMPVLFKTAFSPDGRRIAAVGSHIVLLDVDSGAQTAVPVRGRPTAVAFAPSGIVFGNAEGELWIEAASGLRRIGRHRGAVNSIFVSQDGSRFASASEDGSVQLRRADDGRPMWRGPLLIAEPPRLFSHRG
ncbi:MAG TPA: hypothetical protein VFB62_20955, partial [Polyangiaceae bacterium]|nr:hypothetical protein [Polyangiaceae bacterium]